MPYCWGVLTLVIKLACFFLCYCLFGGHAQTITMSSLPIKCLMVDYFAMQKILSLTIN